MSASANGHLDLAEIFQLLGSSDLSVLEETVSMVKDHMGSLTEPWLLQGLVDFYIQTGNKFARQILCTVRQQQYKTLLNKIDDHMQKVTTRLKSLTLLAHIVRSEPTWIHQILSSRSFQTVIKCLQVDTDLPSITSALYVIVTLLPKVASKVSSCLNVLCGIYIRLVSWHTIKPAGASETNLLHLHTAVYALFLCLYGMYPCFFIKYLQQNFASTVQSGGKVLSSTEKEKSIVFENSIVPMLEQVRLHSRLITDSTENEMSYEKWRKLECQDVVADICKITLDITENSATEAVKYIACFVTIFPEYCLLDCRFSPNEYKGNNEEEISTLRADSIQEHCTLLGSQKSPPPEQTGSIWSPSVMIGLSTPPHPSSELSSPAPSSQHHPKATGQAENTVIKSVHDSRPTSLGMNLNELFIPNRPHQTSSNQSTPLKQLSSLIFPPASSAAKNETQNEKIEMEIRPSKEIGKKEDVEKDSAEIDFMEKDLQILTAGSECEPQTDIIEMLELGNKLTSALKLLDLKSDNKKYLEKSPNELLDLHVQLIADSYTRFNEKFPISSNKDLEWQQSGDGSSNPEVSHLRSQVLQMHCGMLFERYRREQHFLRARKLLRRVYDTAALEERNKSLHDEIKLLKKEAESLKLSNKLLNVQLRDSEKGHESELNGLTKEIWLQKSNIQDLNQTIFELNNERDTTNEELILLKSKMTKADSRLFVFEQQTKLNMDSRDKLLLCENKLMDCERKMQEARETNSILEDQLRWMRGDSAGKIAEAKMLASAYSRELESLKSSARKNEIDLDALKGKFQGQVEELKHKNDLLNEQKAYLENVKSVARGQIKALESKYSAQKHIGQRLEIQVLDLFGRLAAFEGETALHDKTQLSYGQQSIQNISIDESLPQHVLATSPQISPPTKGEVMDDGGVWNQVKTESVSDDVIESDEV